MIKADVFIAILSDGWMRVETGLWLSKITVQSKYPLMISKHYHEPVQSNRSRIVKAFLETQCTHLAMIDADTVPPDNFLDLIEYDKDVISALYCAWRGTELLPLCWQVVNGKKKIPPTDTLSEVDVLGAGVLIIKREVLEKIKNPFEVPYDEDGIALMYEDIGFCKKAKKAGFGVWVHTGFVANHYKAINLESVYNFLNEQKQNPPQ